MIQSEMVELSLRREIRARMSVNDCKYKDIKRKNQIRKAKCLDGAQIQSANIIVIMQKELD